NGPGARGAGRDDAAQGDVTDASRRGAGPIAAAVSEADEDRRLDSLHDDVRDEHAVDGSAVDAHDRHAAALDDVGDVAGRGRKAAEDAVGEDDAAKVAGALRAELEAVGRAPQAAVRDDHVLGRRANAEREARLQAERIVVGLDVAVYDAHAAAAV